MDDNNDYEAQSHEMMVIESILDPHSFHIVQTRTADKPTSGILKIDFDFHPGFNVKAMIRNEDKSFQKISKTLTHMPPLVLHFILPFDYPSNSKPIFTLSSTWLDRFLLSKLCSSLDKVWEEGKGYAVLYSWYSFLKDSLKFLEISTEYDLSWCYTPPHFRRKKLKSCGDTVPLDTRAVFDSIPQPILNYLETFDEEESERIFRLGVHNCGICFSNKVGKVCQRFYRCNHVFCTSCISEYFQGLITDGNLNGVKCPGFKCDVVPHPSKVEEIVGKDLSEPFCVKNHRTVLFTCDRFFSSKLVEEIVGKDLSERYDRLLLNRTLCTMSDIVTCPRPICQSPVLTDGDNLAKCPQCFYVFCSCCKSVYHGVEPCRFKADERKIVYEQYTSGDVEEKKRLEKTFGKKQIDLLVQSVMSENWVNSRSKPCPHCSVPIEKFEGCNKVTCFKCNTYFCWICSSQLDQKHPYLHFNDPNSKCYNNLFLDNDNEGRDEEESEDDEEDVEWGWRLEWGQEIRE